MSTHEEQLAFYKERSDHYEKLVPNLVQQLRVAADLGVIISKFQRINDLLDPLEKAIRKQNATVDRLEAVAGRLETIQERLKSLSIKAVKAEPPPAPNMDAVTALKAEYTESEVVAWEVELDDDDLADAIAEQFQLSRKELRRFFDVSNAILDLEFRLDDEGIVISGRVRE